ncbi:MULTISPECIES: hypothetical protein [Chroococcidiopsis]|nr:MULTISPECIES: hypothetical protein [Chroococcidiopsis]
MKQGAFFSLALTAILGAIALRLLHRYVHLYPLPNRKVLLL